MGMFIDTSTLIKRYIEEKGSDKVDELFINCTTITVSDITSLEFTATLSRKLCENAINLDIFNTLENEYKIEATDFTIIPITADLKNIAYKMIKLYKMKTLDSIQLASAIIAKADIFVTSDKKLFKSAIIELKNQNIFI